MGRRFQPATFPGTAPEIFSGKYTTGQTFVDGALLVFSSGELVECGADPALIDGVALEGAGTKPGFSMANSPTVVTGRVQEVSYAKANRETVFSGRIVNGGTDPVTPAQTDVGVLYGVISQSGDWCVDQSDTTNTRVKIVAIDIDQKIVYFKFMNVPVLNN